MASKRRPGKIVVNHPEPEPHTALFSVCVLVVVLVPLVFSTAVFRIYVLPKLVVLQLGATAVIVLSALAVIGSSNDGVVRLLKSRHVLLVALFMAVVTIATLFGVSPLASLMGSSPIAMGLLTRFCFFALFVGLIVGIGRSRARLPVLLWAMALTGLVASVYACLQFFGRDPFLSPSSYTFDSAEGGVLRVPGTLGHSNYLGNFLLYTTPLSVGLALGSHGRPRRIALAGAALSLAAIAFSGTRGAWLGAVVGGLIFALLETGSLERGALVPRRRLMIRAGVAAAILVFAVATISWSPASRSIIRRARSFVAEGFTGAGRTLLWRDSAMMAPRYAVIGCGPEGFGMAFLAYKSKELARYAPQINNESSHNSYIDAAISFGLAGAVLYVAMIASAIALLLKTRRSVGEQERLAITGIVSSLAAVSVHNFFIYDQIPTGLYFFVFMALPPIVSNLAASTDETNQVASQHSKSSQARPRPYWPIAIAGLAVLMVALWYTMSMARADVAIKQAFHAAADRDFNGVVQYGGRAAQAPDPTGAYGFLFARALARYVDTIKADSRKQGDHVNRENGPFRARAIELAIAQAESSLAHSLTPESNYVLLGYLALAAGDKEALRGFAGQAVRWDPNYFNSRWLMAEAFLADGDREGAIREAELALDLRPGSPEATSVLRRARGGTRRSAARSQSLINRARICAERGDTAKSFELLTRAIRNSGGPCPSCHRALALLLEKLNRYSEALAEWQAFEKEARDGAEAKEAASHIADLKQRMVSH
jgi:O-antigen ligase/tetratricopeptide (TPR) repeat protein